MEKKGDEIDYRRYLMLMATPLILVVAPLVGYFLGYWIDRELHTSPFATYVLLGLGIVAAIREFYKLVKSVDDTDKPNT